MGRFLVHHEGLYLEWSTIVDAPVSFGMTEAELEAHIRWRHGESGVADLSARMARARKQGTSCIDFPYSFDDMVAGNRAGPAETELTKDQLVRIYFIDKRDPDHERPEDMGARRDE